MRIKLLIILMLVGVILSGCTGQTETDVKQKAIDACIEECRTRSVIPEWDWESARGPCLLNPIPDVPDWVCDVAHDPRQDVDNLPENQCSEYGKTANHFVELDPNCEFIKSV